MTLNTKTTRYTGYTLIIEFESDSRVTFKVGKEYKAGYKKTTPSTDIYYYNNVEQLADDIKNAEVTFFKVRETTKEIDIILGI